MTPERILAALVAHAQTVDFRRPDPLVMTERHAPAKRGAAWEAWLTQDELAAAQRWHGIRTALGRDTRSMKRTALHEAAADALRGMPKHCLCAIYTSIQADAGARERIANKLERIATKSRAHDNFWPEEIRRSPGVDGRTANPNYAPDLIELAIRELEYPADINTHARRAEWFGVSERNWYKVVRKPYNLLSGNVWMWYYVAIGDTQRAIARNRRLEAERGG